MNAPGPALTARAAAARVLAELTGSGKTLDMSLPALVSRVGDPRDRALVRELSSGTARWYFQLAGILDQLTERPVKDKLVRAVLLCGLYQLRHTRIPPHAAISESVQTIRQLGRARASGLVNAVLRRYQRESDRHEIKEGASAASRFAYPPWMADTILNDWPQDGEKLLANGNERAPMWLRINSRQTDPASWIAMLPSTQNATQSAYAECAVRLDTAMAVDELPGFSDGLVSVQDAGAQLAAPLMTLAPGMRVLDACAAPGGKSCHMLESADIALTALDNDAVRLERLKDNLHRLQLEATIVTGDAASPTEWWDGQLFDRILVDAPCSATGVIRRHPDIKLLRRAEDIGHMATRQLEMIKGLWPLLAPGGRLLYATCSLLRAENAGVVNAFLNVESSARSRPFSVEWGVNDGPGRQILTGEAGMDGFYYSCLESV